MVIRKSEWRIKRAALMGQDYGLPRVTSESSHFDRESADIYADK